MGLCASEACLQDCPILQDLEPPVSRTSHSNFPTACLSQVSRSLPQSAGSSLARLVGPELHTAYEGTQHLTVLQVARVPSSQHVALGFLIEQPQDLLVTDLQASVA